jgi:hypothetical protein
MRINQSKLSFGMAIYDPATNLRSLIIDTERQGYEDSNRKTYIIEGENEDDEVRVPAERVFRGRQTNHRRNPGTWLHSTVEFFSTHLRDVFYAPSNEYHYDVIDKMESAYLDYHE